jgi:hypothetical protein
MGYIRSAGKISKMTQALARLSGDFAHCTNVLIALACGLLATGIFIIDIASLLLGVAAGVAYVAVESELGRGSSFSPVVPAGSTTGVPFTGPAK